MVRREGVALLSLALLAGCDVIAGFSDYTFGDDATVGNTSTSVGGSGGEATSAGGTIAEGGGGAGVGGSGGMVPECTESADCTSPLVCKLGTCEPVARWATSVPTDDVDAATDVVVAFDGTASVAVNSAYSPARFVRVSPRGEIVTHAVVQASNATVPIVTLHGLAVDAQGTTLVTGRAAGTVSVGGTSAASTSFDALTMRWSPTDLSCMKLAGGAGLQFGEVIAKGPTYTFVGGSFVDSIDLGSGPTAGQGEYDLWIAQLTTPATCSTTSTPFTFGSPGVDLLYALIVDGNGSPVIIANFGEPGTIGTTSVGAKKVVAKLDAALTHANWVVELTDSGTPGLIRAVAAPDGSIVVVASYVGFIDLEGTSYPSPQGYFATLVLKLSSDGAIEWAVANSGDGSAAGYDVAVDNDGNIVVTGAVAGTVDFGGGSLTANDLPSADFGMQVHDVFVWSLDADGHHRYSQIVAAPGSQRGNAIAFDPVSKGFVVAGEFEGTFDLGTGIPLTTMSGTTDAFVMALDP